jgi:hypothetical protein
MTGTDCQKTSPFRPNKGHYKHFIVPVLDQSVSIIVGLVPVPRKDRKKHCMKKGLFSNECDTYLKSDKNIFSSQK